MINQGQKFIVYKSSAGSGKTFTLVREYLSVVLQDPENFRHVLAITFTNKAANEMKDRVVKSLVRIADYENHRETDAVRHLLPQLSEKLGLSEKQISTRAAVVLKLIMHHFAEFAISTIDSFTHRIVRTFAHDLKIPMNFEVELESETMLAEAVDLLISQVGSEEKITRILVDFIEKKAGDEMSWQIENDLNDFAGTLINESGIEALDEIRNVDLDIFMTVRSNLAAWKAKWENDLRKISSEAVSLIENNGLRADSFIGKSKSVYTYLKDLSAGNFDRIKPGSYAMKSLESGEWLNTKSTADERIAFNSIADSLLSMGRELLDRVLNDLSRYSLVKLLLNNLFSTALLSEIEKILDALCLDNNKLLISEFNRRIARIVSEQPAPFIYERLGERYRHYLIDEFQDTSVLQWHNLLPLIENSLASSHMNLLVGDAKQAIYRWRSGDAEQFEALPGLIRKKPDPLLELREKALVNNYRQEYLDRNHRSGQVIVDFNNRFFTRASELFPENYGEAFRHVTQETARKEKPGMVRIIKVREKEEDRENYDDLVCSGILSILAELKEDNFSLDETAILCRDNKSASWIAAFLVRHGISVVSSESLLLIQSAHVNFILAWLRHLADPSDDIQKTHILTYLVSNGLLGGSNIDHFSLASVDLNGNKFQETISGHFPSIEYSRIKNMDVYGMVQYLIFHFGLFSLDDSYLKFFQDAVLNFIRDRRGGLPEFLDWWEDQCTRASVVIPEGIDAVRIMTIHKAKGLQFPAVIYPYADEQVRPTRKNLWVSLDEELARPLKKAFLPVKRSLQDTIYGDLYEDEMNRSFTDMMNVLYVALTRPEERLYVMTGDLPEKTDGTPSVPKLFSRFLMAEGTWQPGNPVYQYGERWQRPARPEQQEADDHGPEMLPCRPSLKMLLRRHAPEAWDMADPELNRRWGNLIHMAMAGIVNINDAGTVLENMLNDGEITLGQKGQIQALIDGLLRDPEIALFFDPANEARNEPEIITGKGYIFRPDRLVIRNGRVTIIDYKTGRHREEHAGQVLRYAALLKEMNYEVDAGFLLYLNEQPGLLKVV